MKLTAIINNDGNPKEVFHFTDNMEFETFSKGDKGGTGDGSLCWALQSFASRSKNFSSAVLQTAAYSLANPVCFVSVNSRIVNPIDISNKVKVIEI